MPPGNAILLARISEAEWTVDADGARVLESHGVDGQVKDGLGYAAKIGWVIGPPKTHVIVENDVSAWKRRMCTMPDGRRERRPYRPEFWRALGMLASGQADGLLAIDLDRATRDPRDLEDLIDLAEVNGIPVESVTGTLRLATSSDIATARIMVSVASKSSADTARRVANARAKTAAAGKFGGGPRRYGFEPDGVTVREDEASVIRDMAEQVLIGVSTRMIAAAQRRLGQVTSRGKPWTAETVRSVLLNPANAGLLTHRPLPRGGKHPSGGRPWTESEIIGPAPWPAIIEEDEWRAVVSIITDPGRRSTSGSTPRWLLSLLGTCGLCGEQVAVITGKRKPSYCCRGCRKIRRLVTKTDSLVEQTVVFRLAREDAADLLPSRERPGPDLAALRVQAASLRERLDEQARLHAAGVIDTKQLTAGSAEIRRQLVPVEKRLEAHAGRSPLTVIAGRPDAAEVWAGLPLGYKRQIIRALCEVVLMPSATTGRTFDPDSIEVHWRK